METGKALPCPSPMIKARDSPRACSSPRPHLLSMPVPAPFFWPHVSTSQLRADLLPSLRQRRRELTAVPWVSVLATGAKTPRLKTASDPRYLLSVVQVTHTYAAIMPFTPAHTSSELFKVTGKWIGAQHTHGICFTQPLARRAPVPLPCTRQQRRNATQREAAAKGGVHVYLRA